MAFSLVNGALAWTPAAAGPVDGNVTSPTLPASTVAYVSTFDREATVYISGGTVTAIAIDGQATGLTSGSFEIGPGQSIAVTYSVAPTWEWVLG